MYDARCGRNGEITVVHLVDNDVGRRLQWRTLVFTPAFGVGGMHVDDGSSAPVHSHGFGVNAGCVTQPAVVYLHIERIELA